MYLLMECFFVLVYRGEDQTLLNYPRLQRKQDFLPQLFHNFAPFI